ncbi:unnamed protein product [Discosporangium mesarthrocarpum]
MKHIVDISLLLLAGAAHTVIAYNRAGFVVTSTSEVWSVKSAFRPAPIHNRCSQINRVSRVSLRPSDIDEDEEAKGDRELERDAQMWIGGNPDRQRWWDEMKANRDWSRMMQKRDLAELDLEMDLLRNNLRSLGALLGLTLVETGGRITPLAWAITIGIQLVPLGLVVSLFLTVTGGGFSFGAGSGGPGGSGASTEEMLLEVIRQLVDGVRSGA